MDSGHAEISIRRQCELLGVNRSGLYYEPLGESEENLTLMRLLDEQYTRAPFYGSRKMVEWLVTQGFHVNRKRVSRLMALMGIEAVYPKPKLSQPGEGHRIYPYLLRGVEVNRVNQVWSTDITYIRMAQGFVYLVAVMDWFSRYVLSWSLSLTMELDFCVEALRSCAAPGTTGDLQQRPGFAVHQREVHRRTGGAGDRHQHGWPGTLYGQHLHRAAVAVAQIRGGVPERLCIGDEARLGIAEMFHLPGFSAATGTPGRQSGPSYANTLCRARS